MTYIEPQYQLPQYAETLGTPMERITNVFAQIGKNIAETFMPALIEVGKVVTQVVEAYRDAVEDATRDNAYRPQGPVVKSTGFAVPEKQRWLE